jgi:hypothetical protein
MSSKNKYLGFESASSLKSHVELRNSKALAGAVVALVRDHSDRLCETLYCIARTASSETLYVVLPDSKNLCLAKRRSEEDKPYLFSVLA